MMKKGLLAALLVGLLFLGITAQPSPSYAETAPDRIRTLSVTGYGKLEVKPDTATISLGISQLKPTPGDAYKAMSAELVKITGSVRTMGIKEQQIQTGLFNLNAEYNWTQEKGQVLVGYRATTMLQITTQDLESVAALIQTAVGSGANQLNGISFSVKDTENLTQKALDVAVDDARAKADQVAKRLGAKVGRVLTVSIQDQGGPIYRAMADGVSVGAAEVAKAAPAPVYGGLSTFTATVYVTFEIE